VGLGNGCDDLVIRVFSKRRVSVLLAVAIVVLSGATARLFVWPSNDPVQKSDAVVVLAGGRGERLHKARALVSRGIAPTLVISNGRTGGWREANQLCDTPQTFNVVCFTPTPDNTRGEAHAIRTLADQRHWDRIVVVTSAYHVYRARLLLERCYRRRLTVVGAAPTRDPLRWFGALSHEWAGIIQAGLQRNC
jgi:uncharacterized SAM-binding protein YcdF (DUF218 family)